MAEFRKIATKSEIPLGKIKVFKINGKQISIANTEGEYFAFDDTCTHEECSLSEGYLDGYTLTCFCHAGQFDISTGEVLSPPPPAPIGVYKVKVEGEDILIEI